MEKDSEAISIEAQEKNAAELKQSFSSLFPAPSPMSPTVSSNLLGTSATFSGNFQGNSSTGVANNFTLVQYITLLHYIYLTASKFDSFLRQITIIKTLQRHQKQETANKALIVR